MHLFFFLRLRNPGILYRLMIALAQGVFFNAYFFMYMVTPSTCHRFVGYLEEEAVHTYTVLIDQIDKGNLEHWKNMRAPQEAINYYALDSDASFRTMVAHVRADEACHRDLNHHFADVPFYADIDHHDVTIVDEDALNGAEPKQKISFHKQIDAGKDHKAEQDEKDTKI